LAPNTATWSILLREGKYEGAGQVELSIRDTKRFIFFFENRGVAVFCDRSEFFLDYTGLGGRGELVVLGNGGSISDCSNSAIRSQRKTSISSVRFLRNRALLYGSALRVSAVDALTDLFVDGCTFEDQLQRPIAAPSNLGNEGGGALWASGVSEVRLLSNVFTGNEASQGGAVYLFDCKLVVIGECVFERNWALLDAVGGGGAAILMKGDTGGGEQGAETEPGVVTIFDSVFRSNQGGGAAAGLYVGGSIKLNLTRVALRNNTSLASSASSSTSLRQGNGGGVGLLVYGSVIGTTCNVSMEFNKLVADEEAVPRNVACSGPFLRNDCVLIWNQVCDLCRRKLLGFELTAQSQPCSLSSNFVWRVETILWLGAVFCLLVVLGGGVWLTVFLVRKRRNNRDVKLLDDEGMVEMSSKQGGSSSKEEVDMGDYDDDDDFDGELEPPGYGARVGWSATAAGGNGGRGAVGFGNSSEELLPSQDFARRFSPSQVGSFKEIKYDELELDPEPIGSGAFGLVYRATWRGSLVAVKKYIGSLDAQGISSFCAEAQLLHTIGNHPNVIKLFGGCTVGPHHCLVVPYYQRGSVRDYFRTLSREERTWPFIASIALQIAAGMLHLHKENIVHRDLAARNVLIDNSDTVCISDFGLARFVAHANSGRTNSNVGAVAWMSPEAVAKRCYSKKSDVWSFGCTLWELCTGKLPYAGVEAIHVAVLVASGQSLPIPDYVPSALASVMRSCWAVEPADRPSFNELYELLKNIAKQL
jgi:hypothetical protein